MTGADSMERVADLPEVGQRDELVEGGNGLRNIALPVKSGESKVKSSSPSRSSVSPPEIRGAKPAMVRERIGLPMRTS